VTTGRVTGVTLIALMLGGCVAGTTPGVQTPNTDMTGWWMLSAPNAPPCGMEFGGAPGAREGTIMPDGGCPANFFMSRRWTLDQDALVINDKESNPLARLNTAGGRFEGRSTAGTPVSLAR
jgi:Protease inhibitor Inh